MTPYLEFSKRWNENNQMKYQNLTEQVDFTAATSNYPYMSPAQLKIIKVSCWDIPTAQF